MNNKKIELKKVFSVQHSHSGAVTSAACASAGAATAARTAARCCRPATCRPLRDANNHVIEFHHLLIILYNK